MRHTPIAIAAGLSLALACTTAFSADMTVRFATFNASLNRDLSGQLLSDLANPLATGLTGTAANRIQQAHNVAEIVLLLTETKLDWDEVRAHLKGCRLLVAAENPEILSALRTALEKWMDEKTETPLEGIFGE
jgi:hypothetical protein